MEVHEIFTTIIEHMLKGLMLHDEFVDYYNFLNLPKYSHSHEEHFLKEYKCYKELQAYYMCNYDKLLALGTLDNPKVVPTNWYRFTREEVDTNTKKSAVKSGLQTWKEWEIETKELYQKMYIELFNLGEIACAHKVLKLLKSVDCELVEIKEYILHLNALDYNIMEIMDQQNE